MMYTEICSNLYADNLWSRNVAYHSGGLLSLSMLMLTLATSLAKKSGLKHGYRL